MDMAKPRAAQIEHLREEFRKRGIRKVKLGGFDVDGVLRGKYVSLDKFWGVADGGLGFCDVVATRTQHARANGSGRRVLRCRSAHDVRAPDGW